MLTIWKAFLSCALLICQVVVVHGIGQDSCVSFEKGSGFALVQNKKAPTILISSVDSPSVHRALLDFQTDVYSVSGTKPTIRNVTSISSFASITSPIIVGTVSSPLISQIVNTTGLDVTALHGKWETFIAKTVNNPLPGISQGYVIAGSDRRGCVSFLVQG